MENSLIDYKNTKYQKGLEILENISELVDLFINLREQIVELIQNKDKVDPKERDEFIIYLKSEEIKNIQKEAKENGYNFINVEIDYLLDILYKVEII
jgi:hypothetical protein